MALSVSTAFFILSCGLWVAKVQHVGSVLIVPNGGRWGRWGAVARCYKGHAIGFRLKVGFPLPGHQKSRHFWGYDLKKHTKNIFQHLADKEQGMLVEPYGTELDSTAVNAISLLCTGGERITSTAAPWGTWSRIQYCPKGKLVAFSLRVQEPNEKEDNTAVNNIKFRCSDGTELMGNGNPRGTFGPWSNLCSIGFICALQTKVHLPQYLGDDTGLNDVRFFCCE